MWFKYKESLTHPTVTNLWLTGLFDGCCFQKVMKLVRDKNEYFKEL